MEFRWVVALVLWTVLSGPVLVQPRSVFSTWVTSNARAPLSPGR